MNKYDYDYLVVLHQDTVKAYVYKIRSGKKMEADVVEILERAKTEFVGVLQKNKKWKYLLQIAV